MSKEVRTRAAERIEALKAEYLVRSKERGMYQKEREKILAEQKGLDEEMIMKSKSLTFWPAAVKEMLHYN